MRIIRLLHLGIACLSFTIGMSETSFAADDELLPVVIELLNAKDNDVRALGLDQVRTEAKGQAATVQFAAQLPKLVLEAQVGLLSALADRGDTAARPAVLDLLATSSNQSVRVAAIEALGFLGEPSDTSLLVKRLTGPANREQVAARTTLIRIRGENVDSLIVAEMKRAAAPLRVTLIEILAARRALATVSEILPAAVDTDPVVRAAAMTALGQLASPEHLPGMVRGVLAAKTGAERDAAEKAVALVCGRISDERKRADPLLAAMDGLTVANRKTILPTLGRIGGVAAFKVVEAAIANPDRGTHDAGFRGLCNWPDASIAERLIELANAEKHPEHRSMARRALIRVAPLPDHRSDVERLELLQKAMTICANDSERNLVIQRARAIRTPQTLSFIEPYLDKAPFAQQACETVVELAHHRLLRDAHKADFDRALDKVIRKSKDATVIDRANRYKKGQTWARPIVTPEFDEK